MSRFMCRIPYSGTTKLFQTCGWPITPLRKLWPPATKIQTCEEILIAAQLAIFSCEALPKVQGKILLRGLLTTGFCGRAAIL